MRRSMLTLLVLACLPTASFAGVAKAPPVPGSIKDTYVGCHWGEVKGKTASVWSMTCDAKHGGVRLVADDALPGFVLVSDGPDGKTSHTAIRLFRKAASAPLASILPAVRAASPGPHTAACALTPLPLANGRTNRVFDLEPTAATKKAWDASQQTSAMPDAPCGPLGVGYAGDNYFQTAPGDGTTVVYVDMGSEVQIFDPATLKLVRR